MKIVGYAAVLTMLLLPATLCCGDEPGRLKDLEVGRQLVFTIAWNGIPVGIVSTQVDEITVIQGRKAYKASLNARTNKWASIIYPVDDTYITYIDHDTSCSLRHEVIRSEGRYRKKAVIDYIYGRFLANYHYLKDDRKKTVNVRDDIHDPLSACYYFLRKDLKIGDEIVLNIDLNEKHYRLTTRIEKGRRMSVSHVGTFETVIARPYAEQKGNIYKRGNGWAYLTLGPEKLPLYAFVSVLIWGRFTATLSRSPLSQR